MCASFAGAAAGRAQSPSMRCTPSSSPPCTGSRVLKVSVVPAAGPLRAALWRVIVKLLPPAGRASLRRTWVGGVAPERQLHDVITPAEGTVYEVLGGLAD